MVSMQYLEDLFLYWRIGQLFGCWMRCIFNEFLDSVLLTCVVTFWGYLRLLQCHEYLVFNIPVKTTSKLPEHERGLTLTCNFKCLIGQTRQRRYLNFGAIISLKISANFIFNPLKNCFVVCFHFIIFSKSLSNKKTIFFSILNKEFNFMLFIYPISKLW